jgi:RhtB (resistance to homoserine/threonine) family protein
MEIVSSLLTVALVSLLAAISPGPDFFVVVKNSLSYSRKIGFLTALGVSLALLIHLSYTLIGIGILITEGSLVYLILKYAGAGYLFYLGCKGLISSFKKQQALDLCYAGNAAALTPVNALKQGFLTNLLNPKCALFFVSLFSQFIVAGTPFSLKLCFACINWSITLGWFLLLSYLITSTFIMARIGSFKKYIDRVMGCVLILLSLKLIF